MGQEVQDEKNLQRRADDRAYRSAKLRTRHEREAQLVAVPVRREAWKSGLILTTRRRPTPRVLFRLVRLRGFVLASFYPQSGKLLIGGQLSHVSSLDEALTAVVASLRVERA